MSQGLRGLRFTNDRILNDTESVLDEIRVAASLTAFIVQLPGLGGAAGNGAA